MGPNPGLNSAPFPPPQKAAKDTDEPYMCLSDFVAPTGSGVNDYLGMFACSAGHGLEDLVAKYKAVRA